MSCYEWEHGKIKLPSGYAPKLRAALSNEVDRQAAKLRAETDRAWNAVKKFSGKKRESEFQKMLWSHTPTLSEEASSLMSRWDWQKKTSIVHRPSNEEIKKSLVSRYNGNQVFHCGSDATITLKGNAVEWSVPENNHATEHAREHALASTLFGFLSRVQWTARSDGEIVGNNEYSREDNSLGGGGNYLVDRYGRNTHSTQPGFSRMA
jgi:hypothetical protein